jgi:hypothetical protein
VLSKVPDDEERAESERAGGEKQSEPRSTGSPMMGWDRTRCTGSTDGLATSRVRSYKRDGQRETAVSPLHSSSITRRASVLHTDLVHRRCTRKLPTTRRCNPPRRRHTRIYPSSFGRCLCGVTQERGDQREHDRGTSAHDDAAAWRWC